MTGGWQGVAFGTPLTEILKKDGGTSWQTAASLPPPSNMSPENKQFWGNNGLSSGVSLPNRPVPLTASPSPSPSPSRADSL